MTMDDSESDGDDAGRWPVEIRGVTESVVTTLGPNDRWNVAALGLREPDTPGDPVRAITFGNTRTRRNFHREAADGDVAGFVQFTRDPVLYVEAALSIREVDEPVMDGADAWVEVEAESVAVDDTGDTTMEHWALHPVGSGVVREVVPTTNRGYNAVFEATVAASRLDVDEYDAAVLRERLEYFEEVCRTCGGAREQEAFDRLNELVDW